MGDAGALFIGFVLSSLTILEHYVSPASSSLFPVLMPALVLAVPLIDTLSVIVIRLREGRPMPSFPPSRGFRTFGGPVGQMSLPVYARRRNGCAPSGGCLDRAQSLDRHLYDRRGRTRAQRLACEFSMDGRTSPSGHRDSSFQQSGGGPMKTVASTLVLLLAALSFVTPSDAAPKMPAAELIDMYALREADSVVIHILANGDISQFLSDRAKGEKSYKLTLDVPALSPIDAKYDVETPFSHGFQMWPMQLEKKYYSRIEIELDLAASSVVGLLNESHLFIRINHESLQQAPVALSAPANAFDEDSDRLPPPIQASPGVAVTPLGVLPIEPGSSDEDGGVAEEPPSEPEFVLARSAPERGEEVSGSAVDENGVNDEELFFNLFPTPAPERQTLFNVTTQDMSLEEGVRGIRVGRFALLPSVDASWMRGSNLLLQSDGPFSENAYLVRGRVTANLLDSAHRVKLTYEGDVPAAVEFGRVAAAPVNTLRAGDKISSRFQDGRMV